MSNERILELAKQCGLKSQSDISLSPQEQKFAELVVLKCVNICEESSIPFDIEIWLNSTKKEMTALTALALADKIKEHFEVE
jgi:hypothetical protein